MITKELERFIEDESTRVAADYNFIARRIFYKNGSIGIQFTTSQGFSKQITFDAIMLEKLNRATIVANIEKTAEELDNYESDELVNAWIKGDE